MKRKISIVVVLLVAFLLFEANRTAATKTTLQMIPLKKSQVSSSGVLSLLTYNVKGLPFFVTGNNTPKRLQAIAPLLKSYDIIGLQEVFFQRYYDILANKSRHRFKTWFHSRRPFQFAGSGLALFSNFPSIGQGQEHFRHCSGWLGNANDCLASKGLQMSRLQIAKDVYIDVYNSHLDASDGKQDQQARQKQVERIKSKMATWSKNQAILFFGDTNLKERNAVDRKTLRAWLKEYRLQDACETIRCPSPQRIDRIFFRSSSHLRFRVLSWKLIPGFVDQQHKKLSDHEPIHVQLAWSSVPKKNEK